MGQIPISSIKMGHEGALLVVDRVSAETTRHPGVHVMAITASAPGLFPLYFPLYLLTALKASARNRNDG